MRTVQLVARCLALIVLTAGFVSAAASAQPIAADYDEFARDLGRGDVKLVVLDDSVSAEPAVWTATWSTGPFHWRRGPVSAHSVAESEFRASMRSRGVRVDQHEDADLIVISWPFRLPAWFGTLLGLTWFGTFLAMLSSRPRWGNRWAWFWMFVVGQIGILIYLLAEPAPLWRGKPSGQRVPSGPVVTAAADEPTELGAAESPAPVPSANARVSGGLGCFYSVVASIGAAILAGVVGWVTRHLLS